MLTCPDDGLEVMTKRRFIDWGLQTPDESDAPRPQTPSCFAGQSRLGRPGQNRKIGVAPVPWDAQHGHGHFTTRASGYPDLLLIHLVDHGLGWRSEDRIRLPVESGCREEVVNEGSRSWRPVVA